MRITDNIGAILKSKGSQVWSVEAHTTVYEAIQLMAEKNVGALIVTKAGQLEGVFTERDYTRKMILHGRTSRETQVSEVVTNRLIVTTPEDSIESCMRLMSENRIRHLPVLDGEELVGIVSIGDLVNWIIRVQTVAIDQLESYISGQYPG